MKKLFYFALLLAASACGSTAIYTVHIENIRQTEPGTIYLETTGVGRSEKDAYNNAFNLAFTTILFKGMPGSVQPEPLVTDQKQAESSHKDAMDCFHQPDCYNKYVTFSEKEGVPVKTTDGLAVKLKIKINLRLLRSYLEESGVIRKFGL